MRSGLVLLALLAGCHDASSRPTSVVEPHAKWSQTELVTCFEDEGMDYRFSPGERELIESAITEQYTPERTVVHFTGWKSCSETSNPNLTLQRGSPEARSSVSLSTIYKRSTHEEVGMGMGSARKVKSEDGKISYVALAADEYAVSTILFGFDAYCGHARMRISKAECERGVVIHEFGHAAGLRHEHVREEARQDPLCLQSRSAHVNDEKRELPGETSTTLDLPYDSRSIMSYCFMDAYENGSLVLPRIELSAGDLLTLQRLYGTSQGPR